MKNKYPRGKPRGISGAELSLYFKTYGFQTFPTTNPAASRGEIAALLYVGFGPCRHLTRCGFLLSTRMIDLRGISLRSTSSFKICAFFLDVDR